MTVSSGLKCSGSLRNSGPLGCLVKMCLGSSIWHSTRCFLTWKEQATPRRRLLYRLAVSMPRTDGTEWQFWPTPMASSWGGTGHRMILQKMRDRGMITEEERRALASGNGAEKINPELVEWMMGYCQAFTQLLPTPRASEYKGSAAQRFIGGGYYRHQLIELLEASPRGIIGRLNPEWLEWLMGFPAGWTELER